MHHESDNKLKYDYVRYKARANKKYQLSVIAFFFSFSMLNPFIYKRHCVGELQTVNSVNGNA